MIWITADLHLNHKNIIRYCDRPFSTVKEMNKTLIENWNRKVEPGDTVFFLGDLAVGRDKYRWLRELNGKIVLIGGNHDEGLCALPHLVVKCRGEKILLIHNPYDANGWDGWVIHGHKHNNDIKNFPFINREEKRINVSTELTNYAPIPFNCIIKELQKRNSQSVRQSLEK